jgi:hypothetical protein
MTVVRVYRAVSPGWRHVDGSVDTVHTVREYERAEFGSDQPARQSRVRAGLVLLIPAIDRSVAWTAHHRVTTARTTLSACPAVYLIASNWLRDVGT